MRELFTDSIRAGLANIDLHDLKEPAPDAKAPELIFKDSVKWTVLPDRLRIECTREFEFEPECNFSLTITYFVEHFFENSESYPHRMIARGRFSKKCL